MTTRRATRSLLLLGVLLLVGSCGSPNEPPPGTRPCSWPDHCVPETAQQLLGDILQRANGCPPEWFQPGDLEAIGEHVARCLEPGLESKTHVLVCDIPDPEPCEWLRDLLAHAPQPPEPPVNPRVAAVAPGRWHTIATDLANFPTGPKTVPE